MQAAQKPRRVILFDELRGVMILSMLAYHICYDLAEVVRLPGMGWFYSDAAGWWQLSICGTFILISGACCFYSKNNLKRGLRLFLLGMLFTLVTALVVPDLLIVFGLLHFLGIVVLLAVPLKRLFELIPPVWGMVVSLLLFWLFYHVQSGWIGLTPQLSLRVPDVFYQSNWLSQQQLSFFRLFPAVPVSVFVLGGNVFGKAAAAGTLLPQPLQSACLPWQKQHLDLSAPPAAGLRPAVADFPILKYKPNFPVGFSKGSWLNRREDAKGLYL